MRAEIDAGTAPSPGAAGLVVDATGDVAVTAGESSQIESGAAGFAYGNSSGIGSIAISIIDSGNIDARILGAGQVTAGGNVQVKATNESVIRNIAGDLAIGKEGGAYGVGVAISHVGDSVTASIDGDAQVSAAGGASFSDVTGATVSGLSIEAASSQSITNLGIGGSISQGTAVNLSVSVSTIDSDVQAYIGAASSAWGTGPTSYRAPMSTLRPTARPSSSAWAARWLCRAAPASPAPRASTRCRSRATCWPISAAATAWRLPAT